MGRLLALCLAALLVGAQLSWAAPPPSSSLESLASELEIDLTRLSRGDAAALKDENVILQIMASDLTRSRPAQLNGGAARRAIVSYLLAGGSPDPLLTLMTKGYAQNDRLVRGVMAYVLGRIRDARALLANEDPTHLDYAIAGQIAFVRSVIADPKDQAGIYRDLDLARLIAPGSLVEEAALRRELGFAENVNDISRFIDLARQYAERFSHSIYAPPTMARIASTLEDHPIVRSESDLAALEPLLANVPQAEREKLLVGIARGALLRGAPSVAAAAAARALSASSVENDLAARAHLYQGAAAILTVNDSIGRAELGKVDKSLLSSQDRAVLKAAQELDLRIHSLPSSKEAEAPSKLVDPAQQDIEAGRTAVAEAAKLVAEAAKLAGRKI